jgi:hypothetical protein
MIPPEVLINGAAKTILYKQQPALRDNLFKLFAAKHSPAEAAAWESPARKCQVELRKKGSIPDRAFALVAGRHRRVA